MIDIGLQLLLFSGKILIILLFLLILLLGIVAILSGGKEKTKGRIVIKDLNKKFIEMTDTLKEVILSKKLFKQFIKDKKVKEKKNKNNHDKKNIFVINFNGDMKASAVNSLREEVTAVIGVATPKDEVVIRLESPGGMVHAYGLAAAQLIRIREKNIPLTVGVDKVAASGGYMMATIANKILAAPFSIIGSIGVIFQMPNFHRLLQEKHIDFEQVTAGSYKRTLTMFGENTQEGRDKLKKEIEEIHHLFKNLIQRFRTQVDIEKVSTGEYWLGEQALDLKLVDQIGTTDDYLFNQSSQGANIYEVTYFIKKSLGERLSASASKAYYGILESFKVS